MLMHDYWGWEGDGLVMTSANKFFYNSQVFH